MALLGGQEHCGGCGGRDCDGCLPALDPPRYCRQCGTWLAVTVTPGGWTARCRNHGLIRSLGDPAPEGKADVTAGLVSGAPKFHTDRSHYGSALRDWLAARFRERRDLAVTGIEIPVATGFSNETVFFDASWLLDDGPATARYVARIEPGDGGMFPVQSSHCEVSVGLQYRVMQAVARTGVAPVPPLVGHEPDPAVLGRPFFVMEFVAGRIPTDIPRYTTAGFIVDEATPGRRRHMIQTGLDAVAGINSLDWQLADLAWLVPDGPGIADQARQLDLYRRWTGSELAGREHPVLATALDWLTINDPNDDRIGLSWGDARLGNIIWEDYRPVAILDWEACALCPTEADIGWWLMFDRMSFDDLGVARLDGYPTRDEMIDYYERVSGRTVRDPHYWEVFGAMRFCAIFIRLGDRMVAAGLIPPEMNPAVGNQVTEALAGLLGIDNPTPDRLAR